MVSKYKVILFLVVAVLLTVVSVTTAQQKQKSTTSKRVPVPARGEPVSAATHQKAKAIAEKFWSSRIIKCGADVWFTLFADRYGSVKVYELREQSVVTYTPTMRWRSKKDILNKVDGTGVFGTNLVLTKVYQEMYGEGLRPIGYDYNSALPGIEIEMFDGKIQLSISDTWHRPYSCEDVEKYISQKKPFLSRSFVCLKRGGSNCLNKPPDIEPLEEEFFEDKQVSPRLSGTN